MSLLSRIAEGPEPAASTKRSGTWWPIRYRPDTATEEVINIGVVARCEDGSLHYRLARNHARIICAYGHKASRHLQYFVEVAEDDLREDREHESDHIGRGKERPFSTPNVDRLLEDLFSRMAPLAQPHEDTRREHYKPGKQTRTLRQNVYHMLRERLDLKADQIIPQSKTLRVEEKGRHFDMDVPLQAPRQFGTIISAQYRRPDTLRAAVLNGTTNVTAAAHCRQVQDLGLFLLRPDEGSMPPEQYDVVDQELEQMLFLARNSGFETAVAELDEAGICNAIIEWTGN